jgi:hypothetical protein
MAAAFPMRLCAPWAHQAAASANLAFGGFALAIVRIRTSDICGAAILLAAMGLATRGVASGLYPSMQTATIEPRAERAEPSDANAFWNRTPMKVGECRWAKSSDPMFPNSRIYLCWQTFHFRGGSKF